MEKIILLNLIALWGVALLLLWLYLRSGAGRARQSQVAVPEAIPEKLEPLSGQAAPEFVAWTLDHERVTHANYLGLGRETLFIFLSTRCPHCRNVLPEVERVAEKLLARGNKVAFVFGESEESTRSYSEKMELTLPILIAPNELSSFTRDYNRQGGVPAFVAINSEGIVTHEGVVHKGEEAWRTFVRQWQAYPTLTRVAALYQ